MRFTAAQNLDMKSQLINVRLAQPAEMRAVKQLWSDSFGDKDPFLSWYFDNVSSPENTVVCTKDNVVTASLQLIDYDVCMGNRVYKAYYIAGVCTDKAFRHMGFGTKIMQFAEEESRRRGKDFVFLCPAIDGFYEQLGYSVWVSFFENAVLPEPSESVDFRKGTISDIDHILKIYNDFAKGRSGYIIRTRRDILRIMQYHDLLGGGIYIKKNGYFIFEKDKTDIRVNEMICDIDDVTAFCKGDRIIVRSENDFGGANKPKLLYKICSDMDEDVFAKSDYYMNILY